MTKEQLSDERLKYAADDFDAYYTKASETQALVNDLVEEIDRLRKLATQFQRDNSALISRLARHESAAEPGEALQPFEPNERGSNWCKHCGLLREEHFAFCVNALNRGESR